MKFTLEDIARQQNYHDISEWHLPHIAAFSARKKLFEYQVNALHSITKILHRYYTSDNGKQLLRKDCTPPSTEFDPFNVYVQKKGNAERFKLLSKYYPVASEYSQGELINGYHFFNRACFWMATGSGKSLVIIKTIELLDHLQQNGLVDKKEILLLLPRDDLINQFHEQVEEFNSSRERKIDLVSLKDYDEDKRNPTLTQGIKVYFYRSDLLRDETKESILDYAAYDNGGDWRVFLDEAHRGEKHDSKMQDYVTILSRNGFLFNFSATFTDELDFATTCFNFNLQKFIGEGYGKNIYLSESYFRFSQAADELEDLEQQKQVLKSLITFAIVKKSRADNQGYPYHAPLLLTLVNSVNTEDSDLKMFFKKLEEIASEQLSDDLLQVLIAELQEEWAENKKFVFGEDELEVPPVIDLQLSDLREQVFHSSKRGRIEIVEGEKGKEIALKLETSEQFFALIKIGDTGKFKKEHLGENYLMSDAYHHASFFSALNESSTINILMGSRSFYEGWDSNRPNVVNFINIGKGNAKKFVLQALGRGLRIEPRQDERKRVGVLPLLETLFVYATNKSAIQSVVTAVDFEKKYQSGFDISLHENLGLFDLLVPVYAEQKQSAELRLKFSISNESKEKFCDYISCFGESELCLATNSSPELSDILKNCSTNGLFAIDNSNNFSNMNLLLKKLAVHINQTFKYVDGVDKIDNEIVHFKRVHAVVTTSEAEMLKEKVHKVASFDPSLPDEESLDRQFDAGELTRVEYRKLLKQLRNQSKAETFEKDNSILHIKHLANHYYLPLIHSDSESVRYIQHIIKTASERKFIIGLENHLNNATAIPDKWMFSKIDESLDDLHIPYLDRSRNCYRYFYPDFIFWINQSNRYKIVFVDPKGTAHADAYKKIDGFHAMFVGKNEQSKVFKYGHFDITVDLKLITENINDVPERYKDYCLPHGDFSFLDV